MTVRLPAILGLLLASAACGSTASERLDGGTAPADAVASADAGALPADDAAAPLEDARAPADDAAVPADDAATGPDAAPSAPDATASAPDAGDRWAAVHARVEAAVRADNIAGLGLAIYDAQDRPVFRRIYGDFAFDRVVAVASASKVVAGMVILDLVARGTLSLDDTTGQVLGWTGPNAAITLRHLLSFTSGLPRNATCNNNPRVTLAECVDDIAQTTLVAPPGTRFDYGSTHLAVAGRMAEVRAGRTWNALFRGTLADPLGLPAEVQYYTAPRQAAGTTNPLVAGGLRASMDSYAPLLSVLFHRGDLASLDVATPALFDEAAREPYPTATIGSSPMASVGQPYRYGLACWLECATPGQGCATVSSPGAFGWTPWVDREHGYYAILGMELSGVEGGVVAFSVDLAQALKPDIEAALGP
jgi:D-alanyl-D-alanine-carboxypeptidase/D-alanyl-D-alanine-endopeptidase